MIVKSRVLSLKSRSGCMLNRIEVGVLCSLKFGCVDRVYRASIEFGKTVHKHLSYAQVVFATKWLGRSRLVVSSFYEWLAQVCALFFYTFYESICLVIHAFHTP